MHDKCRGIEVVGYSLGVLHRCHRKRDCNHAKPVAPRSFLFLFAARSVHCNELQSVLMSQATRTLPPMLIFILFHATISILLVLFVARYHLTNNGNIYREKGSSLDSFQKKSILLNETSEQGVKLPVTISCMEY